MPILTNDIYDKLVRAKVFIDNNFDDAIDLGTIASHACLSAFHFHRLFPKVYQVTPHQYITKKRLQKAKELLKTGQFSVAGICTDIGFESHGSFSVLFKKHHGVTPKSYQIKALRLQQKAQEQPRYVIPSCFLSADATGEK
jgi:AraC-like DNA-binding protein